MPTSSLYSSNAVASTSSVSSSLSLNSLDMDAGAGFASSSSHVLHGPGGPAAANATSSSGPRFDDSRTLALAMELAMFQPQTQTGGPSQQSGNGFSQQQQQHHHHHNYLDHPSSSTSSHHHHHSPLTSSLSQPMGVSDASSSSSNPLLQPLYPTHNGVGGSLEDLKTKRSQNMTECVPVPTSEHVAEIVGRQGCKIKALRAKTNTYIKTPVRGEEPVFVVTGRKEDVALAKREILSAAEHFSQIRASRSKNSINSTMAFGQLVANQPGQTTVHVRVPYKVVGLVVGPKGATIKRIQQQTHTYIVTPSRDKDPVFEVTGLPDSVEQARKEIEAHILIRTGQDSSMGGNGSDGGGSNGFMEMGTFAEPTPTSNGHHHQHHQNGHGGQQGTRGQQQSSYDGFHSAFSSSSGHLDHLGIDMNNHGCNNGGMNHHHQQLNHNGGLGGGNHSNKLNGGSGHGHDSGDRLLDSAFSSLNSNGGLILSSLIDDSGLNGTGGGSGHGGHGHGHSHNGGGMHSAMSAWSGNPVKDSKDSGIGISPPFDKNGHDVDLQQRDTNTLLVDSIANGTLNTLSDLLGGVRLNSTASNNLGLEMLQKQQQQQDSSSTNVYKSATPPNGFSHVGSRSSLDLGTLGRPLCGVGSGAVSSSNTATTTSSNHTLPMSSKQFGENGVNANVNGERSSPPASMLVFQHRSSVSSEPGVNGVYSSSISSSPFDQENNVLANDNNASNANKQTVASDASANAPANASGDGDANTNINNHVASDNEEEKKNDDDSSSAGENFITFANQ